MSVVSIIVFRGSDLRTSRFPVGSQPLNPSELMTRTVEVRWLITCTIPVPPEVGKQFCLVSNFDIDTGSTFIFYLVSTSISTELVVTAAF